MNPFKTIKRLEFEIEELNKKINAISNQVYEIQNPFKFKIGDKAKISLPSKVINVVIVKREFIHSFIITYTLSMKKYDVLWGEQVIHGVFEHELK